MGLYLCVFDDGDNELCGVEVGTYTDFDIFRQAVVALVERGSPGAVCPTLINHSDCDGEWSSSECGVLIDELALVAKCFSEHPQVEYNADWKRDVAKMFGISPKNMLDCFFDVDGEPLVERLHDLAALSVRTGFPVLFQ